MTVSVAFRKLSLRRPPSSPPAHDVATECMYPEFTLLIFVATKCIGSSSLGLHSSATNPLLIAPYSPNERPGLWPKNVRMN